MRIFKRTGIGYEKGGRPFMKEAHFASLVKTGFLAGAALVLACALMLFPKEALDASTRGLEMWWHVVFPSLLPFFIVSELLIGFGVVSFIGVLLEPLMRPLFSVPGIGGFVWAMGLASGNPAGAKLAVRMRQQEKVTRIEGERLAAFTNSSNPLFIFGAIAVGFFHDAALGMVLAIAHYGGNVLVGLSMRFYGVSETDERSRSKKGLQLTDAFLLLHEERLKDGRTLGKLLGDAVRSSIQTLLLIGGFIILFSVLNQMLSLLGVLSLVAFAVQQLFSLVALPPELAKPFLAGLFEITIGAEQISSTDGVSIWFQLIVVSFILGFGGFSVQAQVASILTESDLRFRPFFFARFLHGVFAALLAALLFQPLYKPNAHETGSFGANAPALFGERIWEWLAAYGGMITLCALLYFIFANARVLLRETD
jgi:sporulation integral membrane protein YlbJ